MHERVQAKDYDLHLCSLNQPDDMEITKVKGRTHCFDRFMLIKRPPFIRNVDLIRDLCRDLFKNNIACKEIFVSSVRSSSGYHGLIEIQRSKATFSNFSNSSDSKMKVKVKGPNMCYIFEKHGIQRYRIWHTRVSNVKYTNTQLHKYTNTQIQSA